MPAPHLYKELRLRLPKSPRCQQLCFVEMMREREREKEREREREDERETKRERDNERETRILF